MVCLNYTIYWLIYQHISLKCMAIFETERSLHLSNCNRYSDLKLRRYVIKPKLQVSDKLILINLGEQYLIFDKVGEVNGTITIAE